MTSPDPKAAKSFYKWDVFVSHNRKQKPWVREKVAEWRRKGLRVFFDEDSIEAGSEILEAIEEGIRYSRSVLLILTPSSVESKWVALEASLSLFSDVDSVDRKLLPVMLEPVDLADLRLSIRRLNIVDLSDPERREREYQRLLNALGIGQDMGERGFPVLAAMGTKGGAGKTTIMVAMAELIASTGNHVLIVDADIESGGATQYLKRNARRRPKVWSVLDSAFDRLDDSSDSTRHDPGAWDVTPDYLRKAERGKVFLIPGRSEGEVRQAYSALANIHPESRRNEASLSIVEESIRRFRQVPVPVSAVLIDCGAEMNPLVSAGMVAADSSYIVSSPHIGFLAPIQDYERMHRERFPDRKHNAMNIVVNQATRESVLKWKDIPNAHFVMEDPDFRSSAAAGKVDFEGVGLNNLYAGVLKVLEATLPSKHLHLLPDPVEVWVKPYLRSMKRFPETMLASPVYSLLKGYTALALIVLLSLCIAGGYFAWTGLRLPPEPVVKVIHQPPGVTVEQFIASLEKVTVPSQLEAAVSIVQQELSLARLLKADEKELFLQSITYDPVAAAFTSAMESLEARQSVRLTLGIMGVLVFAGFSALTLTFAIKMRTRKRLLLELIRLRDSGDERGLTLWLHKLLTQDRETLKLLWLREAYRAWLAAGLGSTSG